jgi:hypothetical protein
MYNRGGFNNNRSGGFQKAGGFKGKPQGGRPQQGEERAPPTCNDYQNEAGCGAEIKLVKDSQTGRYEACSLIKYPTFDGEGNCEFRYVPHWLECTAEKGAKKRATFLASQLDRLAQIRASNGAGGGDAPRGGTGGPRGGNFSRGAGDRYSANPSRPKFTGRPAAGAEELGGADEDVNGAAD